MIEIKKAIRDNTKIGEPETSLQLYAVVRQLRSRAIPLSHPQVPPRSSSVPLDRLSTEDKTYDLGFMTATIILHM